jgi:BCD family chlorophyll transporter-like MFS transporter
MTPVFDITRLRIDWQRIATRYLPFADAATPDLPLLRLLRLSLFQVTVGMVAALTVGTLNRVMIVELNVWAWLVALMVALPLVVAPLRALIGLRSDLHKSFLGWRRVPFIWGGTLLQFGGLAIMPFALVLLSGEAALQVWAGRIAAALAFLLVGAGAQTVQTTGLALATDLASAASRPRVVALMYVMLLVGMVGSGLVFSTLLAEYSHTRLVQVVQGAAVATVLLNAMAMWKQEPRDAKRAQAAAVAKRQRAGSNATGAAAPGATTPPATFAQHWQQIATHGRGRRFLWAVGLGTLAFNMQDVILEPYGGEVLGLAVGATTLLTGLMAGGALLACGLAARWLARGSDPHAVAAWGAVVGLFAFAAVLLAAPLQWPMLFRAGATLIGLGGGLFAVGTLTAAMGLERGTGLNGLVIGAWGAVQATCAGVAMALGGTLRDAVGALGQAGWLGEALVGPATGYGFVYHLELLLLLATLAVLGPLVRPAPQPAAAGSCEATERARFGLADLPG